MIQMVIFSVSDDWIIKFKEYYPEKIQLLPGSEILAERAHHIKLSEGRASDSWPALPGTLCRPTRLSSAVGCGDQQMGRAADCARRAAHTAHGSQQPKAD